MKFIALAALSMAYGLVAAEVFRRLTNQAELRRTVNRILAHVLEFRLYVDEPRIVLRAQGGLFRENLRLFGQLALPGLILAVSFALLYPLMDSYFGRNPLPANAPAVITIHSDLTPLELKAPAGIIVETPALRILKSHQTSWRVRPDRASSGSFEVLRRGEPIHASIDIPYPKTHWLLWFALISTAAAAVFQLFSA